MSYPPIQKQDKQEWIEADNRKPKKQGEIDVQTTQMDI